VLDSARLQGFKAVGLTVSPIKGGDGNVEYLASFEKTNGIVTADAVTEKQVKQTVSK
jgi:hypothetical protein